MLFNMSWPGKATVWMRSGVVLVDPAVETQLHRYPAAHRTVVALVTVPHGTWLILERCRLECPWSVSWMMSLLVDTCQVIVTHIELYPTPPQARFPTSAHVAPGVTFDFCVHCIWSSSCQVHLVLSTGNSSSSRRFQTTAWQASWLVVTIPSLGYNTTGLRKPPQGHRMLLHTVVSSTTAVRRALKATSESWTEGPFSSLCWTPPDAPRALRPSPMTSSYMVTGAGSGRVALYDSDQNITSSMCSQCHEMCLGMYGGNRDARANPQQPSVSVSPRTSNVS